MYFNIIIPIQSQLFVKQYPIETSERKFGMSCVCKTETTHVGATLLTHSLY